MSLFKISDIPAYQREVNVSSISPEIIDSINKENFQDQEVVTSMALSFNEDMEMTAKVYLNRILGNDEINNLKANIAEIFQLKSDNIEFKNGGLYEWFY